MIFIVVVLWCCFGILIIHQNFDFDNKPLQTPTSVIVYPTLTETIMPTNTYTPQPVLPSHPSGATAICVDGTYSYSTNRRGTCSHHGGVAVWLK